MAIVDQHDLPASMSIRGPNHYEVTLVQLSFDFYMIGAKPDRPRRIPWRWSRLPCSVFRRLDGRLRDR